MVIFPLFFYRLNMNETKNEICIPPCDSPEGKKFREWINKKIEESQSYCIERWKKVKADNE